MKSLIVSKQDYLLVLYKSSKRANGSLLQKKLSSQKVKYKVSFKRAQIKSLGQENIENPSVFLINFVFHLFMEIVKLGLLFNYLVLDSRSDVLLLLLLLCV